LYSNDRNIHETYRSLSEKAYNMIDSVKEWFIWLKYN
jgi:hypothetical protein